MWSEALSVLDRAERLHRQFYYAGVLPEGVSADPRSFPNWEPPADIVETEDELRVDIALPGVQADAITLALDHDSVVVSALRAFPCREDAAHIHRVEIPYGRFERRIPVALGHVELVEKSLADGMLTLRFRRKAGQE